MAHEVRADNRFYFLRRQRYALYAIKSTKFNLSGRLARAHSHGMNNVERWEGG